MSDGGKAKGIIAVIACCIICFIAGSNYSLSSTSQYIASYLYYNGNPNLTMNDCFFLMPIAICFTNVSSMLGGWLEGKYGARLPVAIGMFLFTLGYLFIYFSTNLFIIYGCMVIIGFGAGLSYLSVLRTGWRHFLGNKGLVSGIILSCFGLSATAYNNIAELIINPDGKKPNKSNNFYDEEVANKIPEYILVIVISTIVLSLFSLLFLFPYIPESNAIKIEFLINTNDQSSISFDKDIEEINIERKEKEPFKIAVKSKQFIIICIMGFCFMFYPYMMLNLARPFGSLTFEENYIHLLVTILPITNGLCRILWGFLIDHISFKILYASIAFTGLLISMTIGIVSDSHWLYFIFCLFSSSMIGANFTLIPNLVAKMFGLKNSAELYGIACLFFGLSSFIGPFITKFLIRDTVRNDYLIIFWIGAFLLLIAFVLCLFLKLDKYDYTKKKKKVVIEETKIPDDIEKMQIEVDNNSESN